MSLTRDQWIELWRRCNHIEDQLMRLRNSDVKVAILIEVAGIRQAIESVIGQMR